MATDDPRTWAAPFHFDPADGIVIREPEGEGEGYWVGAPGVTYCGADECFYLIYRLRRPRGVEPDRGAEIRIARSTDGIRFEDIWSGTKDQVDSTSIERSALVCREDGSWRLYTSYVDPADQRWLVALVEADRPEGFDLSSARPLLKAEDIGEEGVKDPFVFRVGGMEHMIVSYARRVGDPSAEAMHSTNDAYNTGLIESATGLATSVDGVTWTWEGDIFSPAPGEWDRYAARIGTLWYESPVWLALYDGSTDVSENYEERCGVAWSSDLRTFHRVTRDGPLFEMPYGGAIRYFDVLVRPEAKYVYYEMRRPDGSHDMRVMRLAK